MYLGTSAPGSCPELQAGLPRLVTVTVTVTASACPSLLYLTAYSGNEICPSRS